MALHTMGSGLGYPPCVSRNISKTKYLVQTPINVAGRLPPTTRRPNVLLNLRGTSSNLIRRSIVHQPSLVDFGVANVLLSRCHDAVVRSLVGG
jgi:hypothetical protein